MGCPQMSLALVATRCPHAAVVLKKPPLRRAANILLSSYPFLKLYSLLFQPHGCLPFSRNRQAQIRRGSIRGDEGVTSLRRYWMLPSFEPLDRKIPFSGGLRG